MDVFKDIVNSIDVFFEKHPIFRKYLGELSSLFVFVIAAVLFYDMAFSDVDVSEAIHDFSHKTYNLGVIFLTCVFVFEAFFGAMSGGNFSLTIKIYLKRLIALAVVVGVVRLFGDAAADTFWADPVLFSQWLFMLICILLAFKFVEDKSVHQNAYSLDAAYANPMPRLDSSLSDEVAITKHDSLIVAIHEAGHVLVHSLLLKLPDNFMASVNQKNDGSLGRVSTSEGVDILKSKETLNWIMLRNLGGMVAESVIFSKTTSGCTDDLFQWEVAAKRFLQNGFGEYYFNCPSNDYEVDSNKRVLSQLKNCQIEILTNFFSANRELLSSLADDLSISRVLDKKSLEPYLARTDLSGIKRVDISFSFDGESE